MKGLVVAALLSLGVLYGVNQLAPGSLSYDTAWAESKPAEVVAVQVPRGYTDKQGQPCDDQRGGVDYHSEILSREEVVAELQNVGFKGHMVEEFAAISLAESGRQISCVSDENLTDAKWDVSYGVWAIRALKAEKGTGTCRDIDRLRKDDFHDQTVCAYEISGQGQTIQPWSVTHANRGRPYLKYMGQ